MKRSRRRRRSSRFDYDRKIPGIEAVDRYTLRLRLKDTDYNLPYVLAHETLSALAREVVEKYREADGRVMSNPVGSGPYKLVQWVRSSKIVLEANPGFRGFVWDFKPDQPGDEQLVAQMKGKTMPQVGRVEISIMEEDQARWLAFRNGELDLMNMEGPLAPKAIVDGRLVPELATRGVRLDRIVDPEIQYIYWNMRNPSSRELGKRRSRLRRTLAICPTDVRRRSRSCRTARRSKTGCPFRRGCRACSPTGRA